MSDIPRCLFDSDIKFFLEADQEAILGRIRYNIFRKFGKGAI